MKYFDKPVEATNPSINGQQRSMKFTVKDKKYKWLESTGKAPPLEVKREMCNNTPGSKIIYAS